MVDFTNYLTAIVTTYMLVKNIIKVQHASKLISICI